MNEYFFKVYFKDNESGVPFIVPYSVYSTTLEAAKQRLFVESHKFELAHNCKLLYIYYDSDMTTAIYESVLQAYAHTIIEQLLKEGAANEN